MALVGARGGRAGKAAAEPEQDDERAAPSHSRDWPS